jgi:large subunit ribosomal protein L30
LSDRKLKVTLTRSVIGLKPGHVRTLQALGLRRVRASMVHDDTPVIRGMIGRVPYAVRVEPLASDESSAPARPRRSQKAKERSL